MSAPSSNDTPTPAPLTGAQVVVKMLEDHGVTHVFGIPGAKIDKLFDTLVDSRIETVVCRHEQNAAFIAGAIGRMTGKAGVAVATSGPGVSNLVTGLATANTEADPMVAIGGSVAVADRLKPLHQTLDSVAVCKPVTKYAAEIDSPSATAEVLAAAFRAAESGRPGAAFVSLPMDVAKGEAQCRPMSLREIRAGGAHPEAIREAARLLNQAATPVVLLGMLASKLNYAQAVRTLLADVPMPVVGTFQSAGAISEELYRYYGGRVGQIANQPADVLLAAADVVVTIGYDPVEYWPELWNHRRDRPVVHVDVVPADYDNDYLPAVELLGDIQETLRALAAQLDKKPLPARSAGLLQRIAEDRAQKTRQARGRRGRAHRAAPAGGGNPGFRHPGCDRVFGHGVVQPLPVALPAQLPGAAGADFQRPADARGGLALGHRGERSCVRTRRCSRSRATAGSSFPRTSWKRQCGCVPTWCT